METHSYIEIRLPDGSRKSLFGQLVYEDIAQELWLQGVPGLTVFQGRAGLVSNGYFHTLDSEHAAGNPLITIEISGTPEQVHQVYKYFDEHPLHRAQMVLIPEVYSARDIEWRRLPTYSAVKLKIYSKDDEVYHGVPVYHAIVRALQKRQIWWVTVQRAIEGFGCHHTFDENEIFEFSDCTPIIIEALLPTAYGEEILRELRPILSHVSGPAIVMGCKWATSDSKRDDSL